MYKKIVKDGYIVCIGKTVCGETITEEEFKKLQSTISECPIAPDGYTYRLRTDLIWELVELPPTSDEPTPYTQETLETMTNAELAKILVGYGRSASMNKENMVTLILQLQGGGADDLV